MSPQEWRSAVGVLIENARGRESIRSAAKRAGVDEAMWRQVELGFRKVAGTQVPANPRDRNLIAIARAVGLDHNEVLRAAGRGQVVLAPFLDSLTDTERLNQVEQRLDRIEAAVQQLLDDEAAP